MPADALPVTCLLIANAAAETAGAADSRAAGGPAHRRIHLKDTS